ncbi:MAG: hypothetical protein J7577_10680 [Sphingobacteriaceae bacterium]|nr:hypothetical protein [Sphingobacteriaceae bacterium]
MRLVLLLLFLSISTGLFAQEKVAEKAVQKFLIQFNAAKYDRIYSTFSSEYQKKLSKEDMVKYLDYIHGMIKGFRSATFKTQRENEFMYFLICKDKEINADFQCVINSDGKFEYLTFKRIGGKGDPPPVDKMKQ